MRTVTLKITLIALSVLLGLQSFLVLSHGTSPLQTSSGLTPQLIKQGPIGTRMLPSGYYWFQYGAIGDSNSQNVDGASITIRTVFDTVRNDAHSYWVGLSFQNGQFVQVGYLNGLSTTGQPYCCAWFFESFENPSCDCPPTIGPAGSAGPIGSWHTYSMSHVGQGVWSFYMDGQLLGQSPSPGQTNYLGAGATSSGSCSTCAPGGIAEVAQASDNSDVIGPAEFKDITMHKNGGWQTVGGATTYCCYGFSSNTAQSISYGLSEIEGVANDYLAGSNISKSPKGSTLWPVSPIVPSTQVSLNFIDKSGNTFIPDWISLQDLGNVGNILYLTSYQAQNIPQSSTFKINYAYWHGVNVVTSALVSSSTSSQTVQGNVFSIPVRVVGRFYALPVSGATVLTFLPDTTNETVKTDSEGNATLAQLPPGNYSLRVTVPFGVASVLRTNVQGPANLSVAVFSIAELLTVILPPITVSVLVVIVALRREAARKAAIPVTPLFQGAVPYYCRSCGKLLGPTEFFCMTCGTPRSGNLQPSPPQPASASETPPPQQPPLTSPNPGDVPAPPPSSQQSIF